MRISVFQGVQNGCQVGSENDGFLRFEDVLRCGKLHPTARACRGKRVGVTFAEKVEQQGGARRSKASLRGVSGPLTPTFSPF